VNRMDWCVGEVFFVVVELIGTLWVVMTTLNCF